MKHIKPLLIPFLLFLISLSIRAPLIGKGSYCSDTLYLAINAQLTLETFQIHYLQGAGLPLTAVLGAVMIGLTKFAGATDPIFAINLMSVLLSSLSVPLFYLVVKQAFDKTTALIASLLFCFYSLFLAVSVFGNSHTPAIFLFLAGFYFLLRHKNSTTRINFLLSAVAFGLMGAARLQDFIPTIASAAYLFFIDIHTPADEQPRLKNGSDRLKYFIGFILLAVAVVLIFYIPLIQETWTKQTPGTPLKSYWDFAWVNIRRFSITNLVDVVTFLFASQFPLGCFASILGLILVSKNDIKKTGLLIFWFFPIILFLGSIWLQLPRYFIIPSLALFIAQGYLYNSFFHFSRPWKYLFLLLISMSLLLNFNFIYPKIQFRHQHALIEDYYTWVGDITETDAHILERDHSCYIDLFSHRRSIPNPLSNLSYNREEALLTLKNEIDALLMMEKPVYATKTGLTGYAHSSEIVHFILEHYRLTPVGSHLIEEWHKDVLNQTLFDNPLYKIEKK